MDSKGKRKVSPRAPSIALEEAITRVGRMYKAENRHAAPLEVALKHIGYNSKNGASLQAVASLGYWGLVERTKDGGLVVTKAFEQFEFTPNEAHKHELLLGFLRKPALFADMLEQYQHQLPSDATLRYDLIQRGFNPASAMNCVGVFKRSVEFARYFETNLSSKQNDEVESEGDDTGSDESDRDYEAAPSTVDVRTPTKTGESSPAVPTAASVPATELDRILVRLAPGRTAWLEIPVPFYSADKKRLKRHIDLLLTFDEEDIEEENADEQN